MTNVLKSDAELDKDTERMVNGKNPIKKEDSSNYVADMQPFYKQYVEKNKQRFAKWSNKPLFME